MDFQILLEAIMDFFNRWGNLIELILALITLIITIILIFIRLKKRGLSISDILIGLVTGMLPKWINETEKDGGTPDQKKVSVLNKALNFVSKKLGRKLTEEESSYVITQSSEKIEDILETPQKKTAREEASKGGSKNARYR